MSDPDKKTEAENPHDQMVLCPRCGWNMAVGETANAWTNDPEPQLQPRDLGPTAWCKQCNTVIIIATEQPVDPPGHYAAYIVIPGDPRDPHPYTEWGK